MRAARNLWQLVAVALVMLPLIGSTASAQSGIEVRPEVPVGDDCGTATIVDHVVIGGCHIEFEGHISLYAHIPSETLIMSCHWDIEAQLGADGQGFVTRVDMTAPSEPPEVPCMRRPCEEQVDISHVLRPWPVSVTEVAPGEERLEITFCLHGAAEEETAPGSDCELHLPFTALGDHSYELGREGQHAFCEVSPSPFPTSFRDHFELEGGSTERIEVIHHPAG